MGINRFMTPAELPKVSFFQLPYDQMKEGIMSAQMQQDAAREGISQIGDISFNYLTNPKDRELAKNIYGELDSKTQAVLSKQGNGDLRGLRGEIYNLGKEVGRWYKPDGKIGRLQSNYLQYMDWYKRQTENKDVDKNYLGHMANKFIKDYDSKGGAQAGTIHVEDLEKAPDVPKLIKEMEPMIKTAINEQAYAMTDGKYIHEGKDAYEVLGPDKVKRVIAGFLNNSPDYYRFMNQAGTYEYFTKDQLPLLNPVQKEYKDEKTGELKKYTDYDVNNRNPYASSIYAAMEGLSKNDHKQERHMKGDPYGVAGYNHSFDEKTEPLIESNFGEVVGTTQEQVNKIQNNYTGTPQQNQALLTANADYVKTISDHIFDKDGNVKPEFKGFFSGVTDLNGDVIPEADMIKAYAASLHSTKDNKDLFSNSEVIRTYLENVERVDKNGKTIKGYKLNYTVKDGFGKKLGSLIKGLSEETDVDQLNQLDETYVAKTNKYNYPALNAMFKDLRKVQKSTASKPVVTQQSPMKIVPPKSKNPVFATYQDLSSLKTQANSYNYMNSGTGEGGSLSQLLAEKAYDKTVNIGLVTQDPNATNPNEPQRTFLILQPVDNTGKAEGALETIEIFSKTSGTQNQLAVAASHSLQNNKDFYGNFTTGNNAGMNGRVNLYGASQEELDNQDYYNENGK